MITGGDRGFEHREYGERPTPLLRLVLVAAIVVAVHGLIFQRLRIADVGPDLFVVLAVAGGLELGVAGGAAMGVIAGICADMFTYLPIGIWAFVCGVVGFLFGHIRERAFTATLTRPPFALAAMGATGAMVLHPAIALVVADTALPSPLTIATQLIMVSLWAAVWILPVRALLRLVLRGAN